MTRARLAITTIFLSNGFLMAAWVSHLPAIKARCALDDRGLGTVLWAAAAGALCMMPLAGWLATRIGSRNVTIFMALGLCLAITGPLLVSHWTALAAVLFVLGAFNGGLDVAMNTHAVAVQTIVGKPIMTFTHAMYSLGNVIGAVTASAALATNIDPAYHVAAGAALTIIALAFSAPGLLPREHDARSEGPRFAWLPRKLVGVGILCFMALLVEGAMGEWTTVFSRDHLHVPASLAPLGFAAFAATMTLGRFVSGPVFARFGTVRTLMATAFPGAVLLAIALAVGNPIVFVVALAIVGLAIAGAVPVLFSAAGTTPGVPPGIGLAAVATVGYVGLLTGPPLIGAIAGAAGSLSAGLAVCVAALLIIGAGARWANPPANPPTTTPAT